MNGTEVFSWNGRKYAVTFHEDKVLYDPGFRIVDSRKKTHVRRSASGSPKRIQCIRKVMFCILREAYTGTPFCGVSVLHPDERKLSDTEVAKKNAVKRAIASYADNVSDIKHYTLLKRKSLYLDMYSAYRETMLKRYHYDEWKAVCLKKAEASQALLPLVSIQKLDNNVVKALAALHTIEKNSCCTD